VRFIELGENKQIFILSDSTGLTAEMVVNATLSQFKNADVEINRITMLRNRTRLIETIRLAKKVKGIIVHTLVTKELRQLFYSEIKKYDVKSVDLVGSLLDVLTDFLEKQPIGNPGIQRLLL